MKVITVYFTEMGGPHTWRFLDDAKADKRFKDLTEAWKGGSEFVIMTDEIEADYMMFRFDRVLAIELKDFSEASEKDYIAKQAFEDRAKKRVAIAVNEQTKDTVGF